MVNRHGQGSPSIIREPVTNAGSLLPQASRPRSGKFLYAAKFRKPCPPTSAHPGLPGTHNGFSSLLLAPNSGVSLTSPLPLELPPKQSMALWPQKNLSSPLSPATLESWLALASSSLKEVSSQKHPKRSQQGVLSGEERTEPVVCSRKDEIRIGPHYPPWYNKR